MIMMIVNRHHVCDYGIEPPLVLQVDLPSEIGYTEREHKGRRRPDDCEKEARFY